MLLRNQTTAPPIQLIHSASINLAADKNTRTWLVHEWFRVCLFTVAWMIRLVAGSFISGEYQVNIKFNDQHIPNSPYKVQVVPGSAPIFPQPDAGWFFLSHNQIITTISTISNISPFLTNYCHEQNLQSTDSPFSQVLFFRHDSIYYNITLYYMYM